MSFTVRRLRDTSAKNPPKKPTRVIPWKGAVQLLAKASGPLMMIGHLWREQQEKRKKHEARVNMLKRILVILVTVLCAFLLVAGTTKALVSLKVLSLTSIVNVAGVDLPTDTYGHTNILLLGQGDADHDGIDLTDTIMIASLDPNNTNGAALLSLPRDLYFLETENMGKGRINSLYRDYKGYLMQQGMAEHDASHMAMNELAAEIGRSLNIQIHRVLKVDFIGFVQAVDAIDGVDIEVPESIIDTEYPGPNYTYETFQIAAGPQHLDGETALKYARSRHSTSDFDRSARQQQILQAIGDKMQSDGILTKPKQIMDLIGILQEHIETTLQTREMITLAQVGKNLDRSKLLTAQLNSQNGLYGSLSDAGGLLYNPPRDQFGGASVLLPVSLPEFPVTWKQLRAFVELFMHERTAHAEKAAIIIQNAGAAPGSARRIGGELIRYAFTVAEIENAEEDVPISRIVAAENSETALLLANLLGMEWMKTPALPVSDEEAMAVGASPVTILLGEDYEYTPLQDAILSSVSPTE